MSTPRARVGAEFDDAIGVVHDLAVVFDDDDSVSLIAEFEQDLDESAIVDGMQADGRFVEDVDDAHKSHAQLGRQAHPLGFSSTEALILTIE